MTTGKTPSKKVDAYFGGDIPFISPAELSEAPFVLPSKQTLTESGAAQIKLVPENSILVCCIGSLGKLAIANRELGTNQQINSVTFDESKVFPKFGYYALSRLKPVLQSMAPATTVAIVNKSKFEELEIPLPPLDEQKRIAAILDKADAIRRKRQKAILLADDFLSSVFLDMFGDPVTNPKGWELATLGSLIEFAKDGPHVSPKYSESGIPFLSTRHVKPTGVVWEDLKYVSQQEADLHWRKCKPQKGDVLYTKGGTTGIACPVDFEKDFAVWVHVALVRPKAEVANHVWLTHMLNTKYCYQQSQRYTRGATNKDLGLKRMVDIEMYAPPLEEQERFMKVRNKVLDLLSKSDGFANYNFFNSLSQKAFAGEL